MSEISARRRLLATGLSVLGTSALVPHTLLAAPRALTPAQSAGPFYPLEIPLDSDNDLVTVAGHGALAKGEIVNVVGRVLLRDGSPVPGARVEIWQCDASGRYRHPGDRGGTPPDPGFQGYGQLVTGKHGSYRFRTIRPVPYPGRAPHIHFAISAPDRASLVTQMYVAGDPENEHDGLLNRIRDPGARESVVVDFANDAASPGERVGTFDIILAG